MKVIIPGVRTQSEGAMDSNDQAAGEKYTDLEITSLDKFISGDITISQRQEAITGSVRNILLTSFGEMVYDSEAGANLTGLLFGADIDDSTIRDIVSMAIELNEPRVSPLDVEVVRDGDHTLFINVTVNVKGDDTLQDIEIQHRIKNLKN